MDGRWGMGGERVVYFKDLAHTIGDLAREKSAKSERRQLREELKEGILWRHSCFFLGQQSLPRAGLSTWWEVLSAAPQPVSS